MFAVGNVSFDALSKLLTHLGAGPGGKTHVVMTDVREELVVYVNGEHGCSYTLLLALPGCRQYSQSMVTGGCLHEQ